MYVIRVHKVQNAAQWRVKIKGLSVSRGKMKLINACLSSIEKRYRKRIVI